MKKIFLLIASLLSIQCAMAQTDVTDQYLTNAGFDDSSCWQSSNVPSGSTENSYNVAGWTLVKSAAWSSSAAFGFGGGGQINGVPIPQTGYKDSNGGALGISTGWSGICQYTQDVTLPAGKYRISYAAYNALEGVTQSFNFIGFVPDNGTPKYGVINNFLYQTWMTDEIILELTESTKGKISVGLGAVSEGSGKNAKAFIDFVKIEAWNAAETLMPGDNVTPSSWTGNTGTYQNTYPEYYKDNHYTGDVMSSTTNVTNGTYSADVYFHAHMAWISNVANDGTLNSYIKWNNGSRPTEVVNNVGFAAYEPKLYHIDDIKVTDGKLTMKVGNSEQGANWLTVKTEKITKMNTPYVSYGAFPLPVSAVKANFWYQVSTPVPGYYTLNIEGDATISYTQNPTDLTTATFSTTTGGRLALKSGTLYLKASSPVAISVSVPFCGYTVGDVNDDGNISIGDITKLANIIQGKDTPKRKELADMDGNGGISASDVAPLVDILLGKNEPTVVDESYLYADIDAMIYAEQSATENSSNAGYMLKSATDILKNSDVSSKYDIRDYVTTLNISTSLQNVASVSIYAIDQTAIAGPMKIIRRGSEVGKSYSSGTASTYATDQQSDVVTVTGSGSSFTAYLRPVTLAKGIKVTVRTTDGNYYSQDFTNIQTGKVNNLTFTQSQAQNLWMATIPGNTYFSMLSTPGAHDAATSGVTEYTSLSKCQNEDIATLLANGVRAFDLRPGYFYKSTITEDNLYIYHGQVSTNVLYRDAIRILADFLAANPSEAISVVMVKENSKPTLGFSWSDRSSEMWSVINAVHSTYGSYMKLLDHSYYTLDDFRGKICYINRTGTDCTNTVRIKNWPDDATVSDYSCKIGGTCSASIEDEYNNTSKQDEIRSMLTLSANNTDRSRFHYTFTSVANSISSSADTMNPATTEIINTLTGPLCYVYGDFMGSDSHSGKSLLQSIIRQNYKYVFLGRTRIQ